MMALQEQLNRFQKQQEKCQTTLSSIAKSRPLNSKTPQKPISAAAAAAAAAASPMSFPRTPGPAVKFSNDTERLQHINTIRKGAVGLQIRKVIDVLLKTRQALTPEQINEACYVDAKSNKAVFEILSNNPKVKYEGGRFSYKAKYDLKNKDDLLKLVLEFHEGIAVIDLKDAYPTVMEDLQALKSSGDIWLLSNFDSQDIAYPNDARMKKFKVDDELKQLFRGIELPRDMLDIEKDLQKNGMKPATNTTARRAAAQVQGISTKPKTKKKKNEIGSRTRITNIHLPELFQHLRS